MPTTTFPLPKVAALLKQARTAAEANDPNKLLAAFPCLQLKPGYTLFTQLYAAGGNGNGFTYAYPTGARLPRKTLTRWPDQAPQQAEAPMAAIEGDGTPWSYLCASLLGRELDELGAQWHGCSWSTHDLCTADPTAGKDSGWERTGPIPKEFAPAVTQTEESTTVSFYTVSELGQCRLIRHTDQYPAGRGYLAECSEETIAHGPGGYIF
ncbi:MAG TPA: hypothetical protein VNT01_17520 [Symbiobacteriaceae bacterium]|nr:hypothetical protein [Symbiobacteriaceae bacterium]